MSTAGVIILGNSGVGKSFLGNVILGQEAFKHAAQARAVTLTTEYKECQINSKQYAVYNVPGLLEVDQERIDINKREIDRAFRDHPYAVVLYVCGVGNAGRVSREDPVAFNAINDAYPLGEKSLIIIVNNIPTNVSSGDYPKYESETTSDLKRYLKMDLKHICFIYQINTTSTTEKQAIQTKLLDKIKITLPKTHKKEHEIHLQAAEISKLIKQMADLQKQIEEERKENEKVRKQMEDQRKQHQLELERERELLRLQNLRIRDRSPPPPMPFYVPVPVFQSGGMPPENGSRRIDPRFLFDPPRHLRNDGQPDRRFKENK